MNLKTRNKNFIRVIISTICIVLIIFYFKDHSNEITQIKKIRIVDFITLFGLLFSVQIIHSYKFLVLLKRMGLRNVSFWEWFKLVTVSRFVNQHVFQGANIYRFIKLKKDYQFSYTRSLSVTMLYYWLEMISLLLISIAVVSLSMDSVHYESLHVLKYLLFGLFVIATLPFCVEYLAKYKGTKIKKLFKLSDEAIEAVDIIFEHIKKPKFILFYFFVTVLFIGIYMYVIKICFMSIGIDLTLLHNLLFTVVLVLTRMINIVPANLGVSEVICGSLSKVLSISFGSGIIVAGIIRIINYVIYGTVTLITNLPSLRKSGNNS